MKVDEEEGEACEEDAGGAEVVAGLHAATNVNVACITRRVAAAPNVYAECITRGAAAAPNVYAECKGEQPQQPRLM